MTKEEAINVLNDYDINFERNTPEEVAEAHEMAIEALQPQPKERTETHEKTGHWEWVQYESKPNFGNWHCSECRCILCGAINGNPIRLPKYCPECGAKMQEVKK